MAASGDGDSDSDGLEMTWWSGNEGVDQLLFRTRHVACTTGGTHPFSKVTDSPGRKDPGRPEWECDN
jgi:hypothetical protein